MRRALAALGLLLTACTHVTAAAPWNHDVRLMRADEPAEVRRQYRAWFAIWGAVRVSGKDPADVIRDESLCAARVRVEDNVPDAFIGVMYTLIEPIGIIPQSIIVSGQRTCP
ncbi:MAG TPA: hypothetical protein VMR86_16670 [Myxococcota bacterium]|nr:hypothetical protein [Myxococcota bacterium]